MTDWDRVIRKAAPGGTASIISMVTDHADDVFRKYGFTTLKRKAAILAHITIESAYFRKLEENLNYSPERLMQVWPSRFKSRQVAEAYAHNPRKLAVKVYGDRMGNRPGSDDGWTFRGQGLLQITGRYNYQKLAQKLGISPEQCAKWIVDPNHALECACATFVMLGCMPAADAGDVTRQTKIITGGFHGLEERKTAYSRILRELTVQVTPARVAALETREVTAKELRDAGSRTVAGADQAQGALGVALGALSTASGVATQVNDVSSQIASIKSAQESVGGYSSWVDDHRMLMLLVGLLMIGLYAVYVSWKGARMARDARVDDANTGMNIARIPQALGEDIE